MDVGGLFVTWINIFKSLKHANIGSIVVSIICISVLVPIKVRMFSRINCKFLSVGFANVQREAAGLSYTW